ncbi:uncharacterized protein LOC112009319 isoform X3 [Quercus suber]|uniref:uncharacterized protein LOC112009319 isoform X3 n=1 Tax=Quercus suber TaxID=58331 RepID=UPI0032DFB1B0
MLLSQLAMAFPSVEVLDFQISLNLDMDLTTHWVVIALSAQTMEAIIYFSCNILHSFNIKVYQSVSHEITADSQTCQSSINPVHIQQLFARFP